MTIFGFVITRSRRRVELVKAGALTEGQMNAALQVPQHAPIWQTLLQLLATAIENAQLNAAAELKATNVSAGLVVAGYVGGGEHLAMFRDELIVRREEGLKELRAGKLKVESGK